MDFPYHFDNEGEYGENYPASFFVFNKVQVVNLDVSDKRGFLFDKDSFSEFTFDKDTELLLINSKFGSNRSDDCYWKSGPGFQPEVASYLKELMPNLRVVGFDFISITSYEHRALGKVAHKAFLKEEKLLVIEDMKLDILNESDKVSSVVVAPLRYKLSDGCPVTVIASIE